MDTYQNYVKIRDDKLPDREALDLLCTTCVPLVTI